MKTWLPIPFQCHRHLLEMCFLIALLSQVTAVSSLTTRLTSPPPFSYRMRGIINSSAIDFRNTNNTFESLGSFTLAVSNNIYLLHFTYQGDSFVRYAARSIIAYGDGTNELLAGQSDYQDNNITNTWHASVRNYNDGLGNMGDFPSFVLFALFYSKANGKSMDDYLIPLHYRARAFGTNASRTSYKQIKAAPFLPESYAIYAHSAVTNGNLIKSIFGEQVNIFEYKVTAVTNINKLVFPLTAAIKVYRKVEPKVTIPKLNYTAILQITNVTIAPMALTPPEISGPVNVSDLREYKNIGTTVTYSLTNQYILPLSHPAYIKCRKAAIDKVKRHAQWTQKAKVGKTASNASAQYWLLLLVVIPLVMVLISKIMRRLGKTSNEKQTV